MGRRWLDLDGGWLIAVFDEIADTSQNLGAMMTRMTLMKLTRLRSDIMFIVNWGGSSGLFCS